MTITPTYFRQNLFSLLDDILKTGKTLKLNRNGQIIKIMPSKRVNKLKRLIAHPDLVIGNSDNIVDIDWSNEWKPYI